MEWKSMGVGALRESLRSYRADMWLGASLASLEGAKLWIFYIYDEATFTQEKIILFVMVFNTPLPSCVQTIENSL